MPKPLKELEKLLVWYNQTYTTGDKDSDGSLTDVESVEQVLKYVRADIITEETK